MLFRRLLVGLIAMLYCAELMAQQNPIVFVTQVPQYLDFTTITSTLGNHLASLDAAPRGGDLWIRYSNGQLKNLTQAAGYGMSGFQGANSIAVRDPAVHWDGAKVIFSMVIGSATQRYQVNSYRWQLYEITGLGVNDTPVIAVVPNQPTAYNNLMPTYGSDERIIFVSDRPRNGASHLYPQLDEYESAETNTGLWSLNPSNGNLFLLEHSPSGDFHPIIDSFGRVIFTRWDHLQRDQQNIGVDGTEPFNYVSEDSNTTTTSRTEIFPEARSIYDPDYTPTIDIHRINHFFPWMVNQDGTNHETLNHIGRQELHGYIPRSFNDDDNVEEYYEQYSRFNPNEILNMFHIREDPNVPGRYYGIDAPEFATHGAGQIIRLNGAPSTNPDQMAVTYVTHRDTASFDATPSANHSGLYRSPLATTDAKLIAVHSSWRDQDSNAGSSSSPASHYDFRIRTLKVSGGYYVPDQALTTGIAESISYWNPDNMISYSSNLWELSPVELVARTRPTAGGSTLESPEQSIFNEVGVTVSELKQYMEQYGLALVVSRDLTTGDKADHQQPRNLRVNSVTKTTPLAGKVYDIAHVQFFQGDLLRGYGGAGSPDEGRRVLAAPAHDGFSLNPVGENAPSSSVRIASDGSMAAFVPARRALTWHLTDGAGTSVKKERYWLTFQPGEIRVCASCHGVNTEDQAGQSAPQNSPEALRALLEYWKGIDHTIPPPDAPPVDNTPPGDGDSPSPFSLSVRGKNGSGTLVGKANFSISVAGDGADIAARSLSLSLRIRDKKGISDCGEVLSIDTDDAGGYDSGARRVPSTALSFTLIWSLKDEDGDSLDSAKTNFKPGKKKSQVKLKSTKRNSLCRKFESALR